MTSSVAAEFITVFDQINTLNTPIDSDVDCSKKRQRRHILKFKENAYKHKCNKVLKRKLKKYKLRQDGKEDEDVLDVSRTLVSSLIIKSPNYLKEHSIDEGDLLLEELRPRNYLFKMVRRKDALKISNGVKSPSIDIKHADADKISEAVSSQEKKHTNAFQLLMDSRNKSIGGNSPGKERNEDQYENEEILEKKNIKAKRSLLLQQMAEAKGYLKNKEIEEYQDKIIKKKMDKRAERLKTMILKETKPAKLNEELGKTNLQTPDSPKLNHKEKQEPTNNNILKKQAKSWKIVDIFNTLDEPVIVSPEKKHIPKEDQEFLKKLSPSLKKKESMLSYFKKVDKDSECSPVDSENDSLIKVKLQLKPKKRGRKKKLSLKRDAIDLDDSPEINDENNEANNDPKILSEAVVNDCVDPEIKTAERQKRKRSTKIDQVQSSEVDITAGSNESRPKRSIKRPVKYTDEACLSSSDEDMHIFTPKKKKHADSVSTDKVSNKPKQNVDGPVKSITEQKVVKEASTPKKPVKLAPIFASKQLDPAALEAKQKFLQSGVPDKLKKIIQQQKNNITLSNDFPVVVHVQQKDSTVVTNSQPLLDILEDCNVDDPCPLECEVNAFKKLLNLNEAAHIENLDNCRKSTQATLQSIKQLHPKFPVYRTYRYLRGKRKGEFKDYNIEFDNSIEVLSDVVDVNSDSPDRLNWTDKYKAMSTDQIIGNFESIKELRKWLISWTENEIKSKSRGNTGSDSSDYYQSDTDSRESLKAMNNLLILTGPTGSGKTSSVYAVAAELAMKVIEVNASSKRTGKIMLQDLQEATQSHKVNRGTSIDNSQKSQEKQVTEPIKTLKTYKKRGRPKKSLETVKKKIPDKIEQPVLSSTPSSQESTRTGMSLILIDDADIVFEQDDGFSSAIVQLVQCSKRPVILITSSVLCPHLQRFLQNGKILKMCPLLPRLLGTWLDIMCLADSGISWPGDGGKFLNYFNGDIRKTMNYLQFYISSYAHGLNFDEETASQNVDNYRNNVDDENSSMSWADHEELDCKKLTPVDYNQVADNSSMWLDFVEKHSNLLTFRYPTQLFNIWWSIPRLLCCEPKVSYPQAKAKLSTETGNKVQQIMELEVLAEAIDALSLSDFISQIRPDSTADITTKPWYSSVSDSVSEQDYVDYYMSNYEVADEICHTLATGTIARAQHILGCEKRTNLSSPGMSLQRERDRVVSRHKSLSGYLNSSAVLDRRSLALDYWSSCRTICRLEKSKNEANISTKRNNRFCHYLKSLNVLCKSDTFDNLCDSLSNEGTELNIVNFNE
ncbi:enhanced level of genomic instability 1 [Anticarsia gemmatalis]|uniref:enhanced level of genomic instability 1 n=1 Tax=Anticarsia gemmatalis TaxID=129554 RepID=UPI003F771280